MNVIDSVENYIISEFTDRALLLTGGWGVGKTYFWKNSVLPIIEKNKLNPIYISLHGVSTLEQLEAQFLTSLLPDKMQKRVYRNAVNIVSKKLLGSGINEVFKGVKWPELNNAIICYDDLERNKIELDELWGFINYYIEHVNLKTIIISNEEEIRKEYYKVKKEKNISRSIYFNQEIEDVFDNLLVRYKPLNPDFFEYSSSQKHLITAYIKKFNLSNLRTIILFLENLRTVFNYGHSKRNSFETVVLFVLIVTIEFALGNLSSRDISDNKGLDKISEETRTTNFLRRGKELSKEDQQVPEKQYNESFYEKYLFDNLENYIFFPHSFKFIVAGFLDSEGIRNETNLPPAKTIPQHVLAMEALMTYEFRKLEEEEFDKLLPKLLQATEEGHYSIYDYPRIAKGLDFYQESGLIQWTPEELEEKMLQGIKMACKNSKHDGYKFDNIFAFSPDCKLEVKVRNELNKLNSNLVSLEWKSQIDNIFKLLNDRDFEKFLEFMKENQFEPFLQHGNPYEFIEELTKSKNEALFYIDQVFGKRYDYGNVNEFMQPELNFLVELHNLLKNYLEKPLDRKLHYFLIRSISKAIGNSIEKLKT